MTNYQFNFDDEGFSNCVFTSGEGHPPGCIDNLVDNGASVLGVSIPVDDGDPQSCWVRFIIDIEGSADFNFEIYMVASTFTDSLIYNEQNVSSYDSGWVKLSGVYSGGPGTTTEITLNCALGEESSGPTHMYFDTIYINESEPVGGYALTRSGGAIPGAIAI